MNMVNNYTSCLILQILLHFFFFFKGYKRKFDPPVYSPDAVIYNVCTGHYCRCLFCHIIKKIYQYPSLKNIYFVNCNDTREP